MSCARSSTRADSRSARRRFGLRGRLADRNGTGEWTAPTPSYLHSRPAPPRSPRHRPSGHATYSPKSSKQRALTRPRTTLDSSLRWYGSARRRRPGLGKAPRRGAEADLPASRARPLAARAQLAEHGGEYADAASLYAEAAAHWQEFGNVPERAHALLGEGRCLLAIGEAKAGEPLRKARELFEQMGYNRHSQRPSRC